MKRICISVYLLFMNFAFGEISSEYILDFSVDNLEYTKPELNDLLMSDEYVADVGQLDWSFFKYNVPGKWDFPILNSDNLRNFIITFYSKNDQSSSVVIRKENGFQFKFDLEGFDLLENVYSSTVVNTDVSIRKDYISVIGRRVTINHNILNGDFIDFNFACEKIDDEHTLDVFNNIMYACLDNAYLIPKIEGQALEIGGPRPSFSRSETKDLISKVKVSIPFDYETEKRVDGVIVKETVNDEVKLEGDVKKFRLRKERINGEVENLVVSLDQKNKISTDHMNFTCRKNPNVVDIIDNLGVNSMLDYCLNDAIVDANIMNFEFAFDDEESAEESNVKPLYDGDKLIGNLTRTLVEISEDKIKLHGGIISGKMPFHDLNLENVDLECRRRTEEQYADVDSELFIDSCLSGLSISEDGSQRKPEFNYTYSALEGSKEVNASISSKVSFLGVEEESMAIEFGVTDADMWGEYIVQTDKISLRCSKTHALGDDIEYGRIYDDCLDDFEYGSGERDDFSKVKLAMPLSEMRSYFLMKKIEVRDNFLNAEIPASQFTWKNDDSYSIYGLNLTCNRRESSLITEYNDLINDCSSNSTILIDRIVSATGKKNRKEGLYDYYKAENHINNNFNPVEKVKDEPDYLKDVQIDIKRKKLVADFQAFFMGGWKKVHIEGSVEYNEEEDMLIIDPTATLVRNAKNGRKIIMSDALPFAKLAVKLFMQNDTLKVKKGKFLIYL